jgi:hypothetical protein
MPTASRLIGALFFAALAWYVSELVKPAIPTGTPVGWFGARSALYGMVCGWVIMGPRAKDSYSMALSVGFTTVITMLLWGVFSTAFSQVMKASLKGRYRGIGDALEGVFEKAIDYGNMLATQEIIMVLVGGAVVGGLLCGWVARRWD